ncbi:hypothetical protein [Hufsiella ginkgonis]|uniref:Uncharacterized protein n=1 Tax=Hufsiella ginkgonis TaxID=2695274 RepID=A0A7K1XVY8_9SPHI|nr:hypothetical protein [Hufsiella ginkgonis]MXV15141.1 hypothetical protein [Hufsiella ginkgonis]
MKAVVFLCFVAAVWSCTRAPKIDTADAAETIKGGELAGNGSFKPFKLLTSFTVIDTGTYSNELEDGTYYVISRDKDFVDTISGWFGLQRLGKYYVYQKPDTFADSLWNGDTMIASHGTYLLLDAQNKATKLSSVAENLNDYFSSPAVINDKLYYWQLLSRGEHGPFDVHAAEFDIATRKTTSRFLMKNDAGTDYSGYFSTPYLENNQVIFAFDEKQTWKFNSGFNPLP